MSTSSARLPTGTVTFLFSDVEGSTRLVQRLGPQATPVMEDHHRLLHEVFARHDGVVVRTEGDSFFVAFTRASAAAAAALDAQYAMAAHAWPDGAALRVRIGIHTGEAEVAAGDYVGLAVHRAARIADAGHGGQVLVSDATRELIADDLPAGAALRDLGEHRLKDLERSEHLHQLTADALPADFPALRTLEGVPNNLPIQPTSFVGRHAELAEIGKLLEAQRLVTLTGVGGSGKTRLALQAAADALDRFPDGVWLAELASSSDPDAVVGQVARAIGLREDVEDAQTRGPLQDRLIDHLKDREPLLVLDNCEHLLDETARLCDRILRAAEGVRVLATSREGLGIAGEVTYRVPSLALPSGDESGQESDAVRLFVERAAAAAPNKPLPREAMPAVVGICRRLDGIPLAIELAAARTKALSVERLAERLERSFRLLTGGSRAALPRQQTLEATIDWSYDLLEDPERILLARLSVFAGGFSLEAAEAVCADDVLGRDDIVDVLASLIEKSLAVLDDTVRERYRLLETVRQYARAKLVASGEAEAIRRTHRDFYLRLAEEIHTHGFRDEFMRWTETAALERDNLLAAWEWSLDGPIDASLSSLATALWFETFMNSGDADRSMMVTQSAIDVFASIVVPTRHALLRMMLARSLNAIGRGSDALAEDARARDILATEPASVEKVTALILSAQLRTLSVHADPTDAVAPARDAVLATQELGDRWWERIALHVLGTSLAWAGEVEEAIEQIRRALRLAKEFGHTGAIALDYGRLFETLFAWARRGPEADALADEILAWADAQEDPRQITVSYMWITYSLMRRGMWDEADRIIDKRLSVADHPQSRNWVRFDRGAMRWMQGRIQEAADDVAHLRAIRLPQRWYHDVLPLMADVAAEQGYLDEVRATAQRYLHVEWDPSEDPFKVGVLRPLVRAEVDAALVAEGSRREDHISRARDAVETARAILDRAPPARRSAGLQLEVPATHGILAEAELSRATGPDPELWRAAAEGAWMLHTRVYARVRRAEALLATGKQAEGERALREAHSEAAGLGMKGVRELAESVARSVGVTLDAAEEGSA